MKRIPLVDLGKDPFDVVVIGAGINGSGVVQHLKSPLVTKMTNHFQNKIEALENSFYLPNLCNLSKKGYIDMFAHLNTDISYDLFHRNVLIAMERAEKVTARTGQ